MLMKKFIIIGFAVALLVTSLLLWQHFKHPSDAKLTQTVSGSWTKGSTVLVMAHDGSFSESFHFPKGTLTLAGTWQIKDGILIWTTTNVIGPEPHMKVGTVDRSKIVSVDAHRLVYEGPDQGQTISLNR